MKPLVPTLGIQLCASAINRYQPREWFKPQGSTATLSCSCRSADLKGGAVGLTARNQHKATGSLCFLASAAAPVAIKKAVKLLLAFLSTSPLDYTADGVRPQERCFSVHVLSAMWMYSMAWLLTICRLLGVCRLGCFRVLSREHAPLHVCHSFKVIPTPRI